MPVTKEPVQKTPEMALNKTLGYFLMGQGSGGTVSVDSAMAIYP
jgi:hypothetical protein